MTAKPTSERIKAKTADVSDLPLFAQYLRPVAIGGGEYKLVPTGVPTSWVKAHEWGKLYGGKSADTVIRWADEGVFREGEWRKEMLPPKHGITRKPRYYFNVAAIEKVKARLNKNHE